MERVEVEGVVRRPLRDVKDEGEKAFFHRRGSHPSFNHPIASNYSLYHM
jgi:hypothetical protein